MRVYMDVTGEAIGVVATASATDAHGDARLAGLFDQHHRRLYRLARRLTPSADDARDLVQDTFVRIAASATKVPPGAASEEAWLVRVLINICRDGWRKRARRTGRLDEHHEASTPTTRDPEAAFVAHNTIWRALDGLAPRRRAAIVLYELEGASIPDIAQLLGVTAITVRWHLSKGRRELARIIGQEGKS